MNILIRVLYVTGDDDTFYAVQNVGEYSSIIDLNKDMSRLIENIPSEHWQMQFEFERIGEIQ